MSSLAISVVIPSYNRRETLKRCLAALENQTLARDRYEIIVVDDGSRDGTREWLETQRGVRRFLQPANKGPAAARNVGIRAARGEYIIFLGDDILASPDLLEGHVAARASNPGEHVAILGFVDWDRDDEVTPLMRYLSEGLAFQQFRYESISDPSNAPYGCFYTCNLSVNRQFLLDRGLFDEDFRYAYHEDTELAYRLRAHGLRVIFRRDLTAAHRHPTSYSSARRRTRIAGEVSLLAARKHPDWIDLRFLNYGLKRQITNWIKRRATETVLDPFLTLADRQRWDFDWLPSLYDWSLRKHQFWGLVDAVAVHGLPQETRERRPRNRT